MDGVGGNSQDFDLRVTSATDTLEYDDANNDVFLGGLAPNIAGTILTGAATYLKVSHFSATTRAEPYRLYAAVQPPSSAAAPEVEPNDTIAQATLGASLYFSGTLSTTSDVDVFGLDALAGQLLVLGADLDPTRDSTPFNGILSLLDTSGATIVVVNDNASMSNTTSGAGTLSASTPFSPLHPHPVAGQQGFQAALGDDDAFLRHGETNPAGIDLPVNARRSETAAAGKLRIEAGVGTHANRQEGFGQAPGRSNIRYGGLWREYIILDVAEDPLNGDVGKIKNFCKALNVTPDD